MPFSQEAKLYLNRLCAFDSHHIGSDALCCHSHHDPQNIIAELYYLSMRREIGCLPQDRIYSIIINICAAVQSSIIQRNELGLPRV